MDTLNVDLWTFDVGVAAETPQAYAEAMRLRVLQSWDSGADVVVFPEYAWMGLEPFVTEKDKLRGVATLFWEQIYPSLAKDLLRENKAVVLGSVPFAHASGTVRNRVPILCDGAELHQDKLHLTPWEREFSAGEALHVWTLHGVKFAVIICLDIEVPELSVALRGRGVDCLLVPSATESILGVERVGRCASARAVELCCHVGVSQVVGRTQSALVDENVGRLAWLSPSQVAFQKSSREQVTEVYEAGFHVLRGSVEVKALKKIRSRRAETNPALLTVPSHACEIVLHEKINPTPS